LAGEEKRKDVGREEAVKALRDDLGEEEFQVLMDGVDAIIDVTRKVGVPYKVFQEKLKDAHEKGLLRISNGLVEGLEKKPESDGQSP
jgi:hypothetical protein